MEKTNEACKEALEQNASAEDSDLDGWWDYRFPRSLDDPWRQIKELSSRESPSSSEYRIVANPDLAEYLIKDRASGKTYPYNNELLLYRAFNEEREANPGLSKIGDAVLRLIVEEHCFDRDISRKEADSIARVMEDVLCTVSQSLRLDEDAADEDSPLDKAAAVINLKAFLAAVYRAKGMDEARCAEEHLGLISSCKESILLMQIEEKPKIGTSGHSLRSSGP